MQASKLQMQFPVKQHGALPSVNRCRSINARPQIRLPGWCRLHAAHQAATQERLSRCSRHNVRCQGSKSAPGRQSQQKDSSSSLEQRDSSGKQQQQQQSEARKQEKGQEGRQEEGIPVVEASSIIEEQGQQREGEGDALQELLRVLPLMPDKVARQAGDIYLGLAAIFLALGLGLGSAALTSPAILLGADATGPLGAALLGCVAAAALQASGISLHLAGSVAGSELGLWRHQRLNGLLCLFCIITGLAAVWSVTSATPLLTALLVVPSVLGAVGTAHIARDCWAHGPWLQWTLVPGDVSTSLTMLAAHISRDCSTVAGVVCLAWMALSVWGAAGVLLDPSSWSIASLWPTATPVVHLAHAWYPYSITAQGVAVLDLLRRVCGAGLLLSAATAHTLLELAAGIRSMDLLDWLKVNLLNRIRGSDPVLRLVSPPPGRFAVLMTVGVGMATTVQATSLLRAPSLGVDVNVDVALMAPLHWTLMLSILFTVITLLQVDWQALKNGAGRVFDAVAGAIGFVFGTFVLRREWL